MSSAGSTIPERSLGEQARWLAYAALDLLFPPRCASCKRPGTSLCSDCLSAFEAVTGPICTICGRPLAAETTCNRCMPAPKIASIRSAFIFSGSARSAVHAFKYLRRRELAHPLARSMTEILSYPRSDTLLCAVPLHDQRRSSRGYNQAELLAQQLGNEWSLAALPPSALRRTRDTVSQISLDYGQRQQNVSGAFIADRSTVDGNAILLVDDVCTTGATLFACAQALVDAGAREVRAVTFARAPQSP
jgi:ComF family protein